MKKQRGTNEKKENNALKVTDFLHFEQGEYKLNESFNPSLFNIWFAPQLYIYTVNALGKVSYQMFFFLERTHLFSLLKGKVYFYLLYCCTICFIISIETK